MSTLVNIKEYDNIEGFILDSASMLGQVSYTSKYSAIKRSECILKLSTKCGLIALYRVGGSSSKEVDLFRISDNGNLQLQCIIADDIKTTFMPSSYSPDIIDDSKYLNEYSTVYGKYYLAVDKLVQNALKEKVLENLDTLKEIEGLSIRDYKYDVIREVKVIGSYDVKPWNPSLNLSKFHELSDVDTIYKMIVDPQVLNNYCTMIYDKTKKELIEDYLTHEFFIKTALELKKEKNSDIEDHLAISKRLKDFADSKTFNVTLMDGQTVKFDSHLYNDGSGSYFRTAKGWDSIKVVDINKITFGKKIVFER